MIEYSALIIDDDIWMQRILSKTVTSYGFKKNYLAGNGIEGIALAIEHKPNVIFLDIMLPEISGHLIIRILKRIHITKQIPIFMVSALSDVENLGLTVKYGASGYITKPFTRITIYEKLLDVYGKQNLDKIIQGQPIDDMQEYNAPLELITQKEEDELILKTKPDFNSNFYSDKENSSKPAIKQDKFSQHYQEDEKKSLEAIRKMLLKN